MKKLLVACLTIALAIGMSVSALAATGGFISSPSRNPAPELIYGANASEECKAEVTVTAYGDRDQLSVEARQQIEEAYAKIMGVQDLTVLNGELGTAAQELGYNTADLAISDLFDISASDCEGHEAHGHFDITLKPETLVNFVGLLHYYDGAWHVVDSAEVTNNGEHLEFDTEHLSPFAIVVSTADAIVEEPAKANTGLIIAIAVLATGAVVAGVTSYVLFVRRRGQ